MSKLRKPITGETAVKIRVWFTSSGSSPNVPYFERTRMEERYIKVPGHMVSDEDRWSVSTELGETYEP